MKGNDVRVISRRLYLGLVLAVASMSGLPVCVAAQDPPNAVARRVSGGPVIDGRLDDPVWAAASVLAGFVQREPREGSAVSQRTEVRVLSDGDALYVGAWLFDDEPAAIVFGQTRRDAALGESDAFSFVLDTYRDRQNGFVFGTTPAGIEYDGQVANEGQGGGGGGGRLQRGSAGGFNLNWDASWEVATTTDERGWFAEFRIPFSTLRYGAGGTQTWGVNFERRIRRTNEQAVWAPLPRQFTINRVSLAGALEVDAPDKRIVNVTPYLLGDAFRDFGQAGGSWSEEISIGGDAKIGLTQSLTLDLTANTDFALAEVDDQQVNLTRFPLFFPEKRAFFLENAGTFTVGSGRSADLFFSRRIGLVGGREVPILAGGRVTGKIGGLQVGFLNIQTGDAFRFDAENDVMVQIAPNNNFGVLRVFREFSNRSRIGGVVVSRVNTDDASDYNLTYAVDGRLGVGQDLTFDAWLGLTETPWAAAVPDDRDGFNSGEYAFNGEASYVTRDWQISAGYRQVGEEFNPEVGFLSRDAYRHVNARVLRHVRVPSVSWFREFRPHVSWNQYWDLSGFSETYMVHIDNHFAFENGAFFQLPGLNLTGEGLRDDFEIRDGLVIPAGNYDNYDWEFRANTDRSAPVSLSGGWSLGGFFDGQRFGPNGTVSYRYRDRFTASLQLNYFDVELDQGSFTTSVVRFNGSYSFTPRIYLQANVQYNDDTSDLSTNLRFGWLDTAGTGFFVVLNDSRHRGRFAETGIPAGPRQRQLVVKYTKLFDFTR